MTKIAYSVVLILALFGMMFLTIFFHEVIHVIDYKPLNYTDGQFCVVQLQNITYNPSGYFQFTYPKENALLYEKIDKYAEVKAYAISSIIIFISTFAILWIVMKPSNHNLNNKEHK